MPVRVNKAERVIVAIAVAVESLGVAGLWHHRIRAEEAAQGRVVEAGAVIIQPYCTLPALACKAVVSGQGGVGGAARAVGVVALLAHYAPAGIGHQGRGAQVVGEQPVGGIGAPIDLLPQGHPLAIQGRPARGGSQIG